MKTFSAIALTRTAMLLCRFEFFRLLLSAWFPFLGDK
jgi:hypothetical protein